METIKEIYGRNWKIQWQGINVADKSKGALGDITISEDDRIFLAIEVTERGLDRSRIVATFNSKIAQSGLEDYLFLLADSKATPDAKEEARKYFAQGHEINFLDVKEWVINTLGTLGRKGRETFNKAIRQILESETSKVTQSMKMAWNNLIASLIES